MGSTEVKKEEESVDVNSSSPSRPKFRMSFQPKSSSSQSPAASPARLWSKSKSEKNVVNSSSPPRILTRLFSSKQSPKNTKSAKDGTPSSNVDENLAKAPTDKTEEDATSPVEGTEETGETASAVPPVEEPTEVPEKSHDADTPKLEKSESSASMKPKTFWLTRTSFFKSWCKSAFQDVDVDRSGSVDEKELYSGLLLIHLKLGMYAGAAACKPLSREHCAKVFSLLDVNGDRRLDEKEFEGVMMILFSNVLFRVLVQLSMTIMIVPFLASRTLRIVYDTLFFLNWCAECVVAYLAENDVIKLDIGAATAYAWEQIPQPVSIFLRSAIPMSVLQTAPLTSISTILGILLVPLVIMKVDEFFMSLAERSKPDKGTGLETQVAAKDANAS